MTKFVYLRGLHLLIRKSFGQFDFRQPPESSIANFLIDWCHEFGSLRAIAAIVEKRSSRSRIRDSAHTFIPGFRIVVASVVRACALDVRR